MPISRKRKRSKKKGKRKVSKKKVYKPYEVVKHDFVQIENPFPPDMSFEERKQLFVKLGKEAEEKYSLEYEKLLKYFDEFDPLYLCSISAFYFARQEEGIDREAIDGYIDFPPFFLEVLQCLSLVKNRTKSDKPLGLKMPDFETTLKELNHYQSLSYYKLIEKVEGRDDLGSVLIRTEMMVQTLAVRNWAYIHQMECIAYELAQVSEPMFSDVTGFSAKEMFDILFAIVPITEDKLNSHVRKLVKLGKAKNYTEVFKKYEALFPQLPKTNASEKEKIWNSLNKDLEAVKVTLMANADYQLTDIFTHSVEKIHGYLNGKITKDKIEHILERLSLNFGDLSDINKDFIFLDNPVHLRPFIQLNNQEYFSASPHILGHVSVDLLESFLVEDSKLRGRYSKKKGRYLEEKVEQLFRKSFPRAEIYTGSQWGQGEKLYENDLILIIEEFAVIVECKSGTIPTSARWGAPKRLFKTMEQLVVEPSEQAIRFQNFLKQNPEPHKFKTESGNFNEIDSSKIKYYVPLGITFSHLGSIGCNLKKLISAKIIADKFEDLAPSISYTDLEIIFDVLTTEAEKIHYLSRRREFEAHVDFQGDELDLFGFYLDNGFNIGEPEFDENFSINLTLKSKELDPYFIGVYRRVKVAKPHLKKTKYWRDLLRKVESVSTKWLATSFILLNLPYEDQLQFEKELKGLKKRILNNECEKRHNYMILSFGPKRRKYIIAGYPYLADRNTRNDMMNDIAANIEMEDNVRGYLIIGYDMTMDIYPYSVIAGGLDPDLFDRLD